MVMIAYFAKVPHAVIEDGSQPERSLGGVELPMFHEAAEREREREREGESVGSRMDEPEAQKVIERHDKSVSQKRDQQTRNRAGVFPRAREREREQKAKAEPKPKPKPQPKPKLRDRDIERLFTL